MKESEKEVIRDDVKNALNKISGACAIPLIDKLFPEQKKLSDLQDIYSALVALKEEERIMEAIHMIRGLFGIAGREYPYFVAVFETQKELQEFFLSEFLEDFYEVIDDRRLISE